MGWEFGLYYCHCLCGLREIMKYLCNPASSLLRVIIVINIHTIILYIIIVTLVVSGSYDLSN